MRARVKYPIRSCVGCGGRDAQGVLLRFAFVEGTLFLDGKVRMPGRGAYLHNRDACWKAFSLRKGMVRSLRASVDRAAREALFQQLIAANPEQP